MGNRHKGETSFTVEDKTYTLRYSFATLIRLEEKLDRSLVKILDEIQSWGKEPGNVRVGMIRDILWAGLQKHHPDITPDDAADLIDDAAEGLPGMMNILGEAMHRAFNAPGTKGTNPPPKANGTGTTSGLTISATDTTQTHSGTLPPEN